MRAFITRHHDDGLDASCGPSWSVYSGPLSGPAGIRTQLHGLIGDHYATEGRQRRYWWEAWHEYYVVGVELCEDGYVATFPEALAAIREVWSRSPLANAEPYTPWTRMNFAERMAGGPLTEG